MVMHERVLTSLNMPLRESGTVEAEVRGQQKGCCVEGHHAVPAAANGDEEVREEDPARGAGSIERVLQAGGNDR